MYGRFGAASARSLLWSALARPVGGPQPMSANRSFCWAGTNAAYRTRGADGCRDESTSLLRERFNLDNDFVRAKGQRSPLVLPLYSIAALGYVVLRHSALLIEDLDLGFRIPGRISHCREENVDHSFSKVGRVYCLFHPSGSHDCSSAPVEKSQSLWSSSSQRANGSFNLSLFTRFDLGFVSPHRCPSCFPDLANVFAGSTCAGVHVQCIHHEDRKSVV